MSWALGLLVGLTLIFSVPFARAEKLSTSSLKNQKIETDSARKWSGEWQLNVGGESFSEGQDDAAAATFGARANFNYTFTSWLDLKAHPFVVLYSGRLQERFESDEYSNRIGATEFTLGVKPAEFFELRAGNVLQDHLNSSLLVSGRRAFPGAKESLGYTFNNRDNTLGAHFVAQQVIPTSYSLNTERESKEALPSFNTQSLHFTGKNFRTVEWKVFGGHFNWTNLPDKVAWESGIIGNSVTGSVAPGARFRTGFDGWYGGAEFCLCIEGSWIQGIGEFQRLKNDRALSGLGNGQMWGVGPRFIFGERTLEVRYRRYFLEKDVTVAKYSRTFLGGTNRMGDNIEFKLDFTDLKFAVVGEWVNAVPIRDNALQLTLTAFYLGVETHYAPF